MTMAGSGRLLQPNLRVRGGSSLANFEVELRSSTAGLAEAGDHIAGRYPVADGLVEYFGVAVQRHVVAFVADDEQQAEPLQPIGIDYAPEVGRTHLGAARGLDEHAVPAQARGAVRPRILILRRHPALYRPRQPAAHLPEAGLRVQGKVLKHPGEVGNQGFLRLLLAFEPREFLVAAAHLSRDFCKG